MKTQQKPNLRQNIRRLCHWAATLSLMIWLSALVQAAPGSLDFSFGSGGIVVTPITESPYYEEPHSMQVQPDGKIVVGGQIIEYDNSGDYYTVSFFLARYNPNGTLDASFGTNGKVIAPVPYNGEYVGEEIALQPDGKIVAVGYIRNVSSFSDYAVNRYNSDGTLDASFGAGGKVITQVGDYFEFARSVAVQPDGKIVVAGYSYLGGNDWAFAVVRYNANGSLDTSFGTGGKVLTPVGNNFVYVGAVLLQSDGKIAVVGGSGPQNLFTLVRFNADGSLDSGFGSNGKVFHSIFGPANFYDGILQPDGKIVAAGSSNGNTAVLRFNTNGSIDTSFAANGVFTTQDNFHTIFNIALQPNGKIVTFGFDSSGPNFNKFAVLRLNPNGSPDAGFGTNGRIVTPINGEAYAGAVQPDGKILAYGATFTPGDEGNIALVRYLGDSVASRPAQFDFDGDRRADISVFRPSDSIWYLNRSSQGLSSVQFGLSSDQIIPADFDGDGKTDIAVFRSGIWYWLNSSNGNFRAVQFGLAGDIPQPADFDGDGRAELAVYRAGTWFTYNLTNNQSNAVQFGASTDKPVIGDYDGDSRADYAVYRDGIWYLLRSSQGFAAIQFGLTTDKLVPADYDGDGRTDVAVYRDGVWYLQQSSQNFTAFQFGIASDTPAPADYDGDGRTDAAVFRGGTWYLRQTTSGLAAVAFGLSNDKPVPAAYLP